MTPEERMTRLSKRLSEITLEGRNKKCLEENFGYKNLQDMPFKDVCWTEGPHGSDGIWEFKVNLITGVTSSSCEIADGGPFDVSTKIDQIEKSIYANL